jgi:hypothetical protein
LFKIYSYDLPAYEQANTTITTTETKWN